ncbi:MAG: ArsR family transcriptional regulator [Campylobacter sp.]|nr:ArsR family transcriptional regulator [Campylobacter sp.]
MSLVDEILRTLLGEKLVIVVELLCQKADKRGFITLTMAEICELANVSKPTLIKIFKLLEKKKILKRIKNGVYKLEIYHENSQ